MALQLQIFQVSFQLLSYIWLGWTKDSYSACMTKDPWLEYAARVNNLQENAKEHFFDATFSVLVKDSAISPYLFIVLIYII